METLCLCRLSTLLSLLCWHTCTDSWPGHSHQFKVLEILFHLSAKETLCWCVVCGYRFPPQEVAVVFPHVEHWTVQAGAPQILYITKSRAQLASSPATTDWNIQRSLACNVSRTERQSFIVNDKVGYEVWIICLSLSDIFWKSDRDKQIMLMIKCLSF